MYRFLPQLPLPLYKEVFTPHAPLVSYLSQLSIINDVLYECYVWVYHLYCGHIFEGMRLIPNGYIYS